MILTTTNKIDGKSIIHYHSIVTGETIIGANFIKDIFASFTDFFGGRSRTYEKVLIEAKNEALKTLERKAALQRANAVVGISFSYQTIGRKQSMLMVSASGTAVTIE